MFSLKNKKQNRVVFALALFFFASGAFFLTPSTAHAIWGFGWVEDTVTGAFKALLYGIFVMFGWFASVAITIFGWAIRPENISGPEGLLNRASVYASWKLIRDFFNLFFILTLLYTAFTIVFQVAKDYKKTLLSLVLAALFVNFSFPITRVIIDVTNVPMYYFVNQMGTTGDGKSSMGTMLSATRMQDILIPGSGTQGISAAMTDGVGVSNLLMAIVFLFIFSISLLVLAVLFIIRLVALIMLLIFSSVGFAASVIPGLGKYSSMWWEKLWQYALFGPIAMLMLYIATRFFTEIAKDNTSAQFLKEGIANASPESAGFISAMAMFTIPIIMLWMTIAMAASSSIVGASAVAGKGQQFLKWAGKSVTKTPAMFVGRKIDSGLAGSKNFSFLSPGAWKLAIKQRSEEQKHKDEQPIKQTAAKRQDQLNQVISRATGAGASTWGGLKFWKVPGALKTAVMEKGKDHTEHDFAQTQTQSAEYEKEITAVSSDSRHVLKELEAAKKTGNTAQANAALKILVKNNDINDLITKMDPKDAARYGLKKAPNGEYEVSSENAIKALEGVLRDSGEDNTEMLAKRMMVISESAAVAGNYAFGGMTTFDPTENDGHGGFRLAKAYKAGDINPQTGKPYLEDGHEQADWAAGKVKNLESQKRQTTIHPDSLFTRTENGGFGDINGETAKGIISTFTSADVGQVDRSRDDLKEAIHQAYSNIDAAPEFKIQYETNQIFKQYVDEVVKIKRGAGKGAKVDDAWKEANKPGTIYDPSGPPTSEKKEKTPEELRQEGKERRRAQGATK